MLLTHTVLLMLLTHTVLLKILVSGPYKGNLSLGCVSNLGTDLPQ
jgi:hypothetical protein